MPEPVSIKNPAGVDIGNHFVMEASAGTGKTYTITKLLVRLLIERGIPIEKILVMTFTDKATSELKERIRSEIESEIGKRSNELERALLETALSHFANAGVFTIHGFCNKILRENAFETGQLFDLELVDDFQIYIEALNSLKREWIRIPDVESILENLKYNVDWDEKVAKLAASIDWKTDCVRPEWKPWNELLNEPDSVSFDVFHVSVLFELRRRVREWKKLNGLISYDDMVLNLRDSLSDESPSHSLLLSRLRSAYSVALVDEFQDTNMMQWAIFKKIFFEKSNETGNRLMIIGDPKQAIYGFRGADLNAYLRAKDEMLAVGASFYRLSVNYRSMPDLISSFNAFFQPWFGEEADVSAPEDRMGRGPQLGFDNTESVAFNIIDAGSEKRLANRLKRFMAERMAGWVERLIGKMEYHLGKEKRVLGPSDICFLIRKRSEAPFIEEALKELGISSSFYKKPGIYKSAEALQFRIILSALTEQEGKGMLKAFLSIFFGMTPEDLPELERRVPPALESRWLRLLELSRLREWPRFFKGLLDDSGVCFLLADDNRSLTNLKQIAKELTKEAVKGDLDAAALLGRLMEKIDSGGSEDEDLHERDTDKPAVKIMTIHASKGLEFPVVFLFAEMTGKNWSESYLKYYDVDIKRTVYDFSTTLNLDENRKNELAGEKCNEVLRLFYVAFTRSVFKLFVPVYTPASKTGEYTKYVLGRVLESMEGIEEIKPIRNETLPNVLSREAEPKSSEIPFSPSKPPFVAFRTRRIRSFSTLAGKKLLDVADFTLGDPGEAKPLDEFQLPSEKVAAEFVKVYPPPGRKTGDVLHETLERMDFALRAEFANFDDFAVRNELKKLIIECMTANGFKQDEIKDEKGAVVGTLSREFAKLIWNALGKGIPCLDGLRLCDLPREDACKEMGFLLSTGADSLSGIIDLLFRVRDGDGFFTYYILDWKGNHSPEGYSPTVLKETVMKEHGYELQYELYALAVRRWLDSLGMTDVRLGGALYLFCRGVDCELESDDGILFDDLSRFETDKLEERLAAL